MKKISGMLFLLLVFSGAAMAQVSMPQSTSLAQLDVLSARGVESNGLLVSAIDVTGPNIPVANGSRAQSLVRLSRIVRDTQIARLNAIYESR